MKGYKVFNPDWTCRGFQYEVGQIYEMEGNPICCRSGFHFCENLVDCFNYYSFDPGNKVAEVEALGRIDSMENKSCTNKIHIVKEVSWYEVLERINIGKENTGYCNSGNCNSGDWNTADYSSGCFNTIEQNIYLFNKPSSWDYKTWANSSAKYILDTMPKTHLQWVLENNMTVEERKDHPEIETTEGYLRETKIFCEERQNWWRDLPEDEKGIIKSIPNFDADIFKEITGIDVDR